MFISLQHDWLSILSSLRSDFNAIDIDVLRHLNSVTGIGRSVINLLEVKMFIISRVPLDLSLSQLVDWHVASDRQLLDLNRSDLSWLIDVGLVPKSMSNLGKVGTNSRFDSGFKVFKSKHKLVPGKWECDHLDWISNASCFELFTEIKFLWSTFCSVHKIKSIEHLKGVISSLLDHSLVRNGSLMVDNLNIVCCFDPHAIAVLINFIERLTNTIPIIGKNSSVLHKLNGSFLQSTSTLCSIICHDEWFVQFLIIHWNGRSDWVEISCNVVIRFVVISTDVPSWTVVENSLLHFETIRICVESLIIVEIFNMEFNNDFVTTIRCLWKTHKIEIKTNCHVTKIFWGNLHGYNCFIRWDTLIIFSWEIENEAIIRCLIEWIQVSVFVSHVLTILLLKSVGTWICHEFMRFEPVVVICSRLPILNREPKLFFIALWVRQIESQLIVLCAIVKSHVERSIFAFNSIILWHFRNHVFCVLLNINELNFLWGNCCFQLQIASFNFLQINVKIKVAFHFIVKDYFKSIINIFWDYVLTFRNWNWKLIHINTGGIVYCNSHVKGILLIILGNRTI